MADYEKRLQRLEDLTAPVHDRDKELGELVWKRHIEMFGPDDLARGPPSSYDPVWAAEWEAWCTTHASALAAATKLLKGYR